MLTWTLRIFAILMVGFALEDKVRYDDYLLYKLHLNRNITPRAKRGIVRHIILDHEQGYQGSNVSVLVQPSGVTKFEILLSSNHIYHEALNVSVQQLIDDEAKNIKLFNVTAKGSDFGWKNFHELETIHAWLDHLAKKYSEIITVINIGNSYEGRPIKGVKLSYKKSNSAVFVEAGIHGREWISPATATFILHQLLTSTDPQVQYFARNFNWIIFPVCNPDGYKYTFDTDRFWRKNRQSFDRCLGVDLNRNWNTSWNFKNTDPCSNSYPGQHEFSAPETRIIAQYLSNNVKSQKIQTYLSFHSASQMILFPYAVNGSRPPNFDDLQKIGEKAAEALAIRYGKEFRVGAAFDLLYPMKGTSLDWVYSEMNVSIAYAYELRQSTIGNVELQKFHTQFILPVEEIEEAGWETLDSVVALLNEAKARGYYNSTESLANEESPTHEESSAHEVSLMFYEIEYYLSICIIVFAAIFALVYMAKKYKLCSGRRLSDQIRVLIPSWT